MSQQPTRGRGGAPNLNAIRRGGLKKAASSSVIKDLTGRNHGMLSAVQDPEPEQPAQSPSEAAAPTPEQHQVMPQQEYVQHQPSAQQPIVQQAPSAAPPAVAQQYLPQQQPVQYAAPPIQQGPHVIQQPYAQPQQQAPVGAKKKNPPKTAFVQSPEDGERMRASYLATRHLTGHRTLSDFIAYAVNEEVRRLEEQYNNGQQFAPDPAGIPRGRPVK